MASKMKLAQYQIDAFANKLFEGNPAAVCPLDDWLEDSVMQAIAEENNLAETAFFVKEKSGYRIRWFTPDTEIKLCGHATLASAYVLFNELEFESDHVVFNSLSGPLSVTQKEDLLILDFPSQKPEPCETPSGLSAALGAPINHCYENEDYVVVMDNEADVVNLEPDFSKLMEVEARGIIVTARSSNYDFVNRFFGPRVGVNEDAVTGSAYTKLVPYWAQQLGKKSLLGKQVSKRGGEVICELDGERVKLAGRAILFSKGEIFIR